MPPILIQNPTGVDSKMDPSVVRDKLLVYPDFRARLLVHIDQETDLDYTEELWQN